eukprot:c19241_g1_i2 orf=507-2678(-)
MKEDVIDLISDGEDSCEESPEQKPAQLDKNQDEWKENSGSKQVKENGASRKAGVKVELVPDAQNHTPDSEVTFLSVPPPPKNAKGVQGKSISRQFWRAGDYEAESATIGILPNGMDHVRVHPKFLHSNATSHKWALGAIAELLDNSIDEVSNGATFVSVDKVTNTLDNTPALQVHDDGGGMDPDNMRHCMSLGYSRKTSNMTIGQYGNGFKTSTMRLGADVIVFSRCVRDRGTRRITQSVGLLSYTFLRATGHEDVVVPMVDFELVNGKPKMLLRSTKEDWLKNFSTVLQWSPYATEAELLKQFDDLGPHGTKLIVYNLWMNDDGDLELDFDTDKQDIQVRGTSKLEKSDTLQKQLTNGHIASKLRFSLRAYASILYLQMPPNFQIILRGKAVEHLSIANDLKFAERILYKPNTKDFSCKEVSVITTIGFAKEAPLVSVHGFNVYHKNRLIMPFWKVFQENSSRGRGVVGVLEANFMEPAHDKQDFERTPILQRLETRLKQMTIEYWNLHCNLIGYQAPKQSSKNRSSTSQSPMATDPTGLSRMEGNGAMYTQNEGKQGETSAPSTPPQPGPDAVVNSAESLDAGRNVDQKSSLGGKILGPTLEKSSVESADCLKRKRSIDVTDETRSSKHPKISTKDSLANQQVIVRNGDGLVNAENSTVNLEEVLEELKQLRTRCEDYKSREKVLKLKVAELEAELLQFKGKYKTLVEKLPELKNPKEECL